ncbi:polyprotein [Plakobranchus ocellatus]|uniref:Polyprotein n=1 Tax=Plakobranchus ocellatus TaxID=259542 RepID=A0AAV4AQY2_9GAST|nr:polyprotein [Plakobranchus ocellatus]
MLSHVPPKNKKEGREIFNTFNLGEQKLQNIIDAFDNYCKPKENITVERYKFNSRNQTRTETFDQYVTDLKKLAKTCKFGTLQDELIRDKIVCGIANEKIKERLLREDKLTLDKAIDICRAAEESQKHVKMFETDVNLSVNKIKKKTKVQTMHREENTLSTNPRLDRRLTAKLGLKLISVLGVVMSTHQDHAQHMEKHAVHVENKIISRTSAKPKHEKGKLIKTASQET